MLKRTSPIVEHEGAYVTVKFTIQTGSQHKKQIFDVHRLQKFNKIKLSIKTFGLGSFISKCVRPLTELERAYEGEWDGWGVVDFY